MDLKEIEDKTKNSNWFIALKWAYSVLKGIAVFVITLTTLYLAKLAVVQAKATEPIQLESVSVDYVPNNFEYYIEKTEEGEITKKRETFDLKIASKIGAGKVKSAFIVYSARTENGSLQKDILTPDENHEEKGFGSQLLEPITDSKNRGNHYSGSVTFINTNTDRLDIQSFFHIVFIDMNNSIDLITVYQVIDINPYATFDTNAKNHTNTKINIPNKLLTEKEKVTIYIPYNGIDSMTANQIIEKNKLLSDFCVSKGITQNLKVNEGKILEEQQAVINLLLNNNKVDG